VSDPYPEYELRITIRCFVDDLGLKAEDAERPVGDLVDEHELIQAFYDQRRQNPIGAEWIRGLTSDIMAYSLHATRFRGITWHDERNGVVWLMAGRFHTSGDPKDAYPTFLSLDADDRLLPDRPDFEALLFVRSRDAVEGMFNDAPRLVEEARAQPGRIIPATLGGRIDVRVAVEGDDPAMLVLTVSSRVRPGELPIPGDWVTRVVAAFFPEQEFADLSFVDDIVGDPLREDETGWCYFVEQ
jgi:hypothetical protein